MLKPLGKRVVLKRFEAEEKTASGIVLPGAKEKPQLAEVLAVGTEVQDVKVGDKVVFKKYGGTEFKVDGEDVLIYDLEDVLAILE